MLAKNNVCPYFQNMKKERIDMNLVDHFLVAMPDIGDPLFEGSVIYLCRYDKDGAMGVVINKPSPVTMDLVFAAAEANVPQRFEHESVMMGGPVQLDRGYVVHSPIGNWQSSMTVNEGVALTTSRDIIENLAKPEAVDQAVVCIGHASWSAGQLEKELAANSWLTVPFDQKILFELPYDERYQAALGKIGIRPHQLMQGAGHA